MQNFRQTSIILRIEFQSESKNTKEGIGLPLILYPGEKNLGKQNLTFYSEGPSFFFLWVISIISLEELWLITSASYLGLLSLCN